MYTQQIQIQNTNTNKFILHQIKNNKTLATGYFDGECHYTVNLLYNILVYLIKLFKFHSYLEIQFQ